MSSGRALRDTIKRIVRELSQESDGVTGPVALEGVCTMRGRRRCAWGKRKIRATLKQIVRTEMQASYRPMASGKSKLELEASLVTSLLSPPDDLVRKTEGDRIEAFTSSRRWQILRKVVPCTVRSTLAEEGSWSMAPGTPESTPPKRLHGTGGIGLQKRRYAHLQVSTHHPTRHLGVGFFLTIGVKPVYLYYTSSGSLPFAHTTYGLKALDHHAPLSAQYPILLANS